ncbi:hypothetical protein F5X68DRAFT_244559 [Plectosphaerella plurivora]|uniref:Mitochondrial inner membrane protein 1 protein n=1 Tax=Plectosphaerella plurivora TaxID=936078 RepID=A0A9P9AFZ0_9PEZI|nr:hypothetical protein F5X68DRAFT_244559 [Plectosphaerella plurivora]
MVPRLAPRVSKAYYAGSPYDKIDTAAEKKTAQKKLESRPEEVSTESTTRKLFEPDPAGATSSGSVTDGLQHDIDIVKDTFRMEDVPKEPYVLGLAGTIPYLFTSLSTVYLSWDLNTTWPSSSAFLNHIYMNHDDAKALLALLEPVQLGYGAVIISFLGAVHWGMEYAARDTSATRTRFRYGMGVLAPVIAWPTLLMPIEMALTSQFAAFTLLYMADTNATTRGWTPTWYGRYRFILTAIVGVAIFVSLVGRAKIGYAAPRLGEGLADKMHKDLADTTTDWAKLEAEERRKNREEKEKAEQEKEKAEKKKAASKSKKGKSSEEEKGASSDSKAPKEKDESGNKKQSDKAAEGDDEGKDESENEYTKEDGEEEESNDESEKKEDDKGKGESKDKDEGKDKAKDEGKDKSKDEDKDEGKDEGKDEAKEGSTDGEKTDGEGKTQAKGKKGNK